MPKSKCENSLGSHFKNKLTDIRRSLKLTLDEVEQLTGVPAQTLHAYESGRCSYSPARSRLSKAALDAICELYEITPAKFESITNDNVRNTKKSKCFHSPIENKLSEYRENKNLSVYDVATSLNIAETTYSNWERCKSRPSADNIKKLGTFYGVSAEEIEKAIKTPRVYTNRTKGKARVQKNESSENWSLLKRLRVKSELSGTALAELLGIDATTIYSYETGKYFPRADILKKCADVFNVSYEELAQDFYNRLKNKDKRKNKISAMDFDSIFTEKKEKKIEPDPIPEHVYTTDVVDEKVPVQNNKLINSLQESKYDTYKKVLERCYGKIGYEDFLALTELVESLK